MQNVICKSCGKPMLSKFQRGGQASGSELTNNIGYWHCEGCDVYVFHAEYVAGKSKLFHKLLHQTVETLKKFNRRPLQLCSDHTPSDRVLQAVTCKHAPTIFYKGLRQSL